MPDRIRNFLRALGPGIVTGAADDDPSGIATYSQTGAQFGYGQLWTALYQLPLMIAVQEACARIGAVTGRGLAGVVRANYSRAVLYGVVGLVVVANTINIGADIGAVAAAIRLIFNIPFTILAIGIAVVIVLLEVLLSYKTYAKGLKWLSITLLAYPITALVIAEPWGEILRATVVPHIEFSFQYFFIVTGVFGTSISPYMFFWQASEEVEEELEKGIIATGEQQEPPLPDSFIPNLRIDTMTGMLAAEVAQWFIIIATGTVLFSHGIDNIATAADAARAFEPLVQSFPYAGLLAKLLFAVGIIGLGFLGIPVLAGSAAYAFAEALGWREGLSKTFRQAPGFYGVIIVSTLVGLLLNFSGVDPIRALVWTAVFNGIAAVPLLFVIAKINGSKIILGNERGGVLSRTFVWFTFGVMACSGVGLLCTLVLR